MSVLATSAPAGASPPIGVGQLGRVEARRLLTHPAYLLAIAPPAALALYTTMAAERYPSPWLVAYFTALLVLGWFYPLMTLVAAYRVAAGTYRRKAREPLDATPLSDRRRTIATIIAVARGPVLVAVVGMVLLDLMAPFVPAGVLGADPSRGGPEWAAADPNATPSHALGVLDHLQIPLVVLGGGLLGIALARWVLLTGTPIIATLALWIGVAINNVTAPTPSGAAPAHAWLGPWMVWFDQDGNMPPSPPIAQNLWHAGYLLGLSLLAGMAALLRTPGGRRPLLAASLGLVVMTALAGWLQIR
jgi:hypothetical protein